MVHRAVTLCQAVTSRAQFAQYCGVSGSLYPQGNPDCYFVHVNDTGAHAMDTFIPQTPNQPAVVVARKNNAAASLTVNGQQIPFSTGSNLTLTTSANFAFQNMGASAFGLQDPTANSTWELNGPLSKFAFYTADIGQTLAKAIAYNMGSLAVLPGFTSGPPTRLPTRWPPGRGDRGTSRSSADLSDW